MTDHEFNSMDHAIGILVGVVRHFTALYARRQQTAGFTDKGDLWDKDIEASCAEGLTSKEIGQPCNYGLNTFHGADIGKDIQVRHSIDDDASLIFRDSDNPAHYYVLVTGRAPHQKLRGWMRGFEIKMNAQWKKSPGGRPPAWFVPQDELRPFPLCRE